MQRHSRKSKQRWGEYSEWVWEADQKFWYRVRQDAEGNLDYDYNTTPDNAPQQDASSGRDPGVDELTQGLENLNYVDADDDFQASATARIPSSSGKVRSSKASKGKGRSDYDTYDDTTTQSSRDHRRPSVAEEPDYGTYTYQDAGLNTGDYIPTGDASYYPDVYSSGQGSSSRSEASHIGAYTTAPSSYDPTYASTSSGNYPDYGSAATGIYGTYEDEGEDDGRRTPRGGFTGRGAGGGGGGGGYGGGDGGDGGFGSYGDEALDPRYRIERSDRFQPGEIFKAGWAEPKGAANDMLTGLSGKQEIEDTRGVTFITGFRRFIVIANDQGHATCVPILTYGGKGCKKKGTKPEKHGIIYQRGQRAKLLENEPKLGFPPVKMDITMEGERLSKESRVNYSKLVTVEHNVKVMFIGTITANDWPIVTDAIDRCWTQKDHHKGKRHRR